jgi:hypothetical protein
MVAEKKRKVLRRVSKTRPGRAERRPSPEGRRLALEISEVVARLKKGATASGRRPT